jgi:hypothetical protein
VAPRCGMNVSTANDVLRSAHGPARWLAPGALVLLLGLCLLCLPRSIRPSQGGAQPAANPILALSSTSAGACATYCSPHSVTASSSPGVATPATELPVPGLPGRAAVPHARFVARMPASQAVVPLDPPPDADV